jgi:hypothetical protein
VTSTSCSAAMRSSRGATGAPWRHNHTVVPTRCVCMDSASAVAPQLWGREDHVGELFAGSGVQLEFERDTAIETEPFETGREAVDFVASNFGPLMMLRGRLEAQGVWDEVREKLEALYDRHDPAEYLVVLGRKG